MHFSSKIVVHIYVALRKESVDRKILRERRHWQTGQSLSARRAWIEKPNGSFVAVMISSLSARRAWIEKQVHFSPYCSGLVALRKESVDRKSIPMKSLFVLIRRSPQGERG